jgi:hypothetical protein
MIVTVQHLQMNVALSSDSQQAGIIAMGDITITTQLAHAVTQDAAATLLLLPAALPA